MGRQLLAGILNMNALLVLSIFIAQSLGQASAECPAPTIGNCSATDYRCDLGFNAGCWMGSFCMPEGSICPMICNTPAPSNCTAAETVCDMGSYGGCWSGDYCMPNGTVCPPVCNTPAPSNCQPGEDVCDNGWDSTTGCWLGDHCMPMGTCPKVCNSPAPSNCTAGEIVCDMGSYEGCWKGDICIPEGSVCPHVCNYPTPSQCLESEVLCDMGLLKAVGMGTTAQLMELSVLRCVTTLFPPNVWPEKSPVTWDIMLGAGWEISAMRIRMDSSVLQFATGPLTLYVRMARFCATWVLMPITAGWEITACQRAPSVQPLQEFDQTSDVSI